jgi:hypothetical protein
MTISKLAEVRARLDKSAQRLTSKPPDTQEEFDQYESLAIAILDSEHEDFAPGILEEYLMTLLYLKQLELGLLPDTGEQ